MVWSRYPRPRKSAWQRVSEAARREARRVGTALAPGVFVIALGLGLLVVRCSSGSDGGAAPQTSDPQPVVRRLNAESRPSIHRSVYVIDGDTIEVEGTRIRLADINAPEVVSPKCDHELALGRRAKERLAELIAEGPIDVVYIGGHNVDRYGRSLRIIKRDGRSLGDILVTEGLARRWSGRRRGWGG